MTITKNEEIADIRSSLETNIEDLVELVGIDKTREIVEEIL